MLEEAYVNIILTSQLITKWSKIPNSRRQRHTQWSTKHSTEDQRLRNTKTPHGEIQW